ncbi:DUF6585 family protein [Catellatospora vulcania]|uniref:DUF6585 family protein n=1 Tax=Catellatospora vulcania TaxID=1460450 RepID=UPI0012D43833|nr:DUF6585 family protein [Catellatospora vulcania]
MESQQGPRSVEQAVAEADLGELHGRYRPAVGADIAIVVCCVALGLVLLAAAGAAGAVVAMGVGVLALGAVGAWVTWRKANTWRHLYTGGTLTVDHRGTVTSLVTWHDIAHVRYWTRVVNLGTAYAEVPQCRLDLAGGEVVDLAKPRYQELPELVAFVDQQVSALVLPRRLDELRTTGVVTFGPVTLMDEGVRWRELLVPWGGITRIEFGKTRLKIWTGGRSPVVSQLLSALPDRTVLTHLIAHWPELRQASEGSDPPVTPSEPGRESRP